jgi:hypothetical protein
VGGYSTVGFIDSISGLYTAPSVVPSPAVVTVHATSKALSSAIGSASITVTSAQPSPAPVTVKISPASATVDVGRTHQFTATVQNASVVSVSWKVNGIAGGNIMVGKISSTGLYTAPNLVPTPAQVTVSATSIADPNASARASVTIDRSPPRR